MLQSAQISLTHLQLEQNLRTGQLDAARTDVRRWLEAFFGEPVSAADLAARLDALDLDDPDALESLVELAGDGQLSPADLKKHLTRAGSLIARLSFPPALVEDERWNRLVELKDRGDTLSGDNLELIDDQLDNEDCYLVPLFYGTDRTVPAKAERAELSFGACTVTIPKKRHRMGAIENPFRIPIINLEFPRNSAKHFTLRGLTSLARADFIRQLQDQSAGKSIFLFIHGFNVSFQDAAFRAAQLTFDLQIEGAGAFYSWPSHGRAEAYTLDESNIENSHLRLKQFVQVLLRESGARTVHILAHSMGGRGLGRLIQSLSQEEALGLGQIIFVAPDIDAQVFKEQIVPAMQGKAQRITLYSHTEDLALQLSNRLHQYPRAGQGGDGLVVVAGIDTIDSSDLGRPFFGLAHSASLDGHPGLHDIFQLLLHQHPPDARLLNRRTWHGAPYWALKA